MHVSHAALAFLADSTSKGANGESPTALVTWTTLGSMTVLTAVTTAVTNTLRSVFQWSAKWIGLLVAFVLALGVAIYGRGRSPLGETLFLGILNAFLVYASAAGLNSIGSAVTQPGPPAPQPTPPRPESPNVLGAPPARRQAMSSGYFAPWF